MTGPRRVVEAFAPAKVNLYLHVGPVDDGGYHPIASLGVFADVGDTVAVAPSDRPSLTIDGPFAAELGDPAGNLVLTALRRLGETAGIGEPPLAVRLTKRLPVASGLGGGSSDAGAALRAALEALALDLDDLALETVAFSVGADGPLCLWGRAAVAEGRGERLSPAPALPPLPAVLVNPRAPSHTGAVYRAYDAGAVRSAEPALPPATLASPADVARWLADQRNDLEAPARALQPAIDPALAAVRGSGALLTRLSGSGATVFGLFGSKDEAAAAAARLRAGHPGWWVALTTLA